MTAHSPLGFSGAERYFPCPGSVALIAALPPDAILPEPEYTRAGTAAHAAWAECLREGLDAWEVADREWEGYKLTEDDLVAGQVYLDNVRDAFAMAAGPIAPHVELIEWEHHAPAIHELAKGTIDYALIIEDHHAEITDYKHGEGMYVNAEQNKQLMGYAALLLDAYPNLTHFTLRIVQPRCQPYTRPSEWEISADDLRTWIETELKPAMILASDMMGWDAVDISLKAGEWCRFCPVQKALACPEHKQLVAEFEQAAPLIERMTNEQIDALTPKVEALEMAVRSFKAERERRALAGVNFLNSKVVPKKVFRVWKDGAEVALSAALGPCVMTKPELKGPAEMEKLGKMAKQLTKEYSYSPDAGYTVAPIGDRRKAVIVQPPTANDFDKYLDKPELF